MKLFASALFASCFLASIVSAEPAAVPSASVTVETASKVEPKIENKTELTPRLGRSSGNTIFQSNEGESSSVITMFEGLAACLGVFFIGLHFYRKFHGNTGVATSRTLTIKERLSISPKTSLVIIEWEGKPLLLAVGPDTVSFHQPPTQFSNSLDLECENLPLQASA